MATGSCLVGIESRTTPSAHQNPDPSGHGGVEGGRGSCHRVLRLGELIPKSRWGRFAECRAIGRGTLLSDRNKTISSQSFKIHHLSKHQSLLGILPRERTFASADAGVCGAVTWLSLCLRQPILCSCFSSYHLLFSSNNSRTLVARLKSPLRFARFHGEVAFFPGRSDVPRSYHLADS